MKNWLRRCLGIEALEQKVTALEAKVTGVDDNVAGMAVLLNMPGVGVEQKPGEVVVNAGKWQGKSGAPRQVRKAQP